MLITEPLLESGVLRPPPRRPLTPGIEECGYNIMSADSFQNPCFATNSYRAFTVKIEKCDRPERIWVESKEFEPFMPTLQNEPVTEEVF